MNYVVLQVVLKENNKGTGFKDLSELEDVINEQATKGYRLHSITPSPSPIGGVLGAVYIQFTLVFEEL